ncbi:unnamed protein product [Pedinophyceae sp. YPF-701]|nr:unnamed protein product [Pedinophyceae sp. YPF-701]
MAEGKAKDKKRRRSEADGEQKLAPEELARREKQRKLREVALAKRAAGQQYVSSTSMKRRARSIRRLRAREAEKRAAAPEREAAPKGRAPARKDSKPDSHTGKHAPKGKVQVVVLPLYHKTDKATVVDYARRVSETLKEHAYAAWLDVSESMPGEKMRYWEEQGVVVRVEVGLREARSGDTVVVALSQGVGKVAKKHSVSLEGSRFLELVEQGAGAPALRRPDDAGGAERARKRPAAVSGDDIGEAFAVPTTEAPVARTKKRTHRKM